MRLLPVMKKIGGSNRHFHTIRTIVVAEAKVNDCFYYQLIINTWTFDRSGHIRAVINGKTVYLSRFIWILAGNSFPLGSKHAFQLHHKDEDNLNNQLDNLELLSNSDHVKTKGLRVNSLTGECGIYPSGIKFQVQFYENGKMKYFGTFPSIEAAIPTRDREFARIYPGRTLPR